MTYSDKDPVEVTLGVCEHCNNYVPFVRLITENETRVYQCMTCKTKHVQHVNGKVVFNFLEDAYTLKGN